MLAGCVSAPAIHVQQDDTVDFSVYRTYAWKQLPPISNPMLRQRVVSAVDAEFAAKGWRSAPDAQADVLLVGNVSSREDASLNYFYQDAGWDGWNWHGHASGGIQRIELRVLRIGTLVLDVFDARTQRAIWRGLAQGYVPDSEARQDREAIEAVRRMFREFPEAARER
ncbi:DUF4136 domain-containing protein [Tahibacter caeni]|uniref:DUF4136 domain-containing protein n=1 Tax=Tahibacter caeni TaxID=1453545 RepID=UPI0021480E71|nr:DUF4136 domain-containing protein [Tahibacter caeni]